MRSCACFFSSLITHRLSLHSLLRENFDERREQPVVLFGRADAHAEIISEHRVAAHVADEYVAREQFAEDALRLYLGTHDHEVRVRAQGRETVDSFQTFVEPLALSRNSSHGRRK